jgi:two-component system chemotaxis sensor kinase CheA
MDHGLESPDERLKLKKPAAGTILLQMDVQNSMLQIKLSDDGRGLSLARIRKIALEKELISVDEQLGDEETASLILRPGFTTAEIVTEVSGRGVGMDAVQNFVKRENGTIRINFTDNNIGADFRHFEIIVSLPKGLSESVEGFNFHHQDGSSETYSEVSLDEKRNKAMPLKQA